MRGYAIRIVLLGVAATLMACESSDSGSGDGPDITPDPGPVSDTTVDGPPTEGTPSPCGGLVHGHPLSGGSSSAGDDRFRLLGVNGGERDLAFDVKEGASYVFVVNLRGNFRIEDDGRSMVLDTTADTGEPMASGDAFAEINNSWGGIPYEAQVCLDEPLQAGKHLTGSYAVVVEILATEHRPAEWYRLTGTFDVPGDQVTAAGVDVPDGATVTVD